MTKKIQNKLLAGALLMAGSAMASSVAVPGTADIYEADGSNAGGGAAPIAIALPANSISMTFSTAGAVVLNIGTGTTYNDPDGVGAIVSSSTNSGTSTISGVNAPNAGYLVGLFLPASGATSPAPASLTYTSTDFSSFSPLLDQTFFIGDGLTGDGTGSVQTFYVPTGASTLYLGISDACGYNGAPSCYGDNGGSFTTNYTIAASNVNAAPEPGSYALLGGGLVFAGFLRRKFFA